MAKQRDAIRMTADEVAALFDSERNLQVATLGADGAPHLTTVWFARDGERLLFETYGKSQKIVNLRRDPRIAVLAEAGEGYAELRGVSINGRAEVVDSGERLLALMETIVRRIHPGVDPAPIAAQMATKRVVVVVHPEKTVSWDHRKLVQPGA